MSYTTCTICDFKCSTEDFILFDNHLNSELHKEAVYRKKHNLPDEPTCCECEDCILDTYFEQRTLICNEMRDKLTKIRGKICSSNEFDACLGHIKSEDGRVVPLIGSDFIIPPSFCWKRELMNAKFGGKA